MPNCHSLGYNPSGSVPPVRVPCGRHLVEVDACVADTVKVLLEERWPITGSCCGHGRGPVVLSVEKDAPEDTEEKLALRFREIDQRDVSVFRLLVRVFPDFVECVDCYRVPLRADGTCPMCGGAS